MIRKIGNTLDKNSFSFVTGVPTALSTEDFYEDQNKAWDDNDGYDDYEDGDDCNDGYDVCHDSHHDKIPPWWENVSNDKVGNVLVSKTHHTPLWIVFWSIYVAANVQSQLMYTLAS